MKILICIKRSKKFSKNLNNCSGDISYKGVYLNTLCISIATSLFLCVIATQFGDSKEEESAYNALVSFVAIFNSVVSNFLLDAVDGIDEEIDILPQKK